MAPGSLTCWYSCPVGSSPSLNQTELVSVGSRRDSVWLLRLGHQWLLRLPHWSLRSLTQWEASLPVLKSSRSPWRGAEVPINSQHHLPCPMVSLLGSRSSSPSQVTITPADIWWTLTDKPWVGTGQCFKRPSSTRSLLTFTCHIRMALGLEHFLPRGKEPSQPMLGLPACVGISFPVSCPVCTSLFCLEQSSKALRQNPSFLYFWSVGRGRVLLLQQKVGCVQLHHLWSGSAVEWIHWPGAGWILGTLALLLLQVNAVPLEPGVHVIWSQWPRLVHWSLLWVALTCVLTLAAQPGHHLVNCETPTSQHQSAFLTHRTC